MRRRSRHPDAWSRRQTALLVALGAAIWLLVAAAVTIVACIAVWIALGRYEQRRANANLDLANAPLPELAPVAESAVTPETGNLFRVAIPAGDRPVFGRAARRPETA